MPLMYNRRSFLIASTALAVSSACFARRLPSVAQEQALRQCAELEARLNGRLGIFAFSGDSGWQLAYRADERFALCSTFKLFLAAAILAQSRQSPGLLQQTVHYRAADLVSYSPVTARHVGVGMSVTALCAATVQHSDNTAANLLLRVLGGPERVTAFLRACGDAVFRLDRWEPELNSAIPGDARDTSTPHAVGTSLHRLVLGEILPMDLRAQLRQWMLGSRTGALRIKAGIPPDWIIGDKTGTGQYGSANDIAVLWPPGRRPLVLAVYTRQHRQQAAANEAVIAAAARIVVDSLG